MIVHAPLFEKDGTGVLLCPVLKFRRGYPQRMRPIRQRSAVKSYKNSIGGRSLLETRNRTPGHRSVSAVQSICR